MILQARGFYSHVISRFPPGVVEDAKGKGKGKSGHHRHHSRDLLEVGFAPCGRSREFTLSFDQSFQNLGTSRIPSSKLTVCY